MNAFQVFLFIHALISSVQYIATIVLTLLFFKGKKLNLQIRGLLFLLVTTKIFFEFYFSFNWELLYLSNGFLLSLMIFLISYHNWKSVKNALFWTVELSVLFISLEAFSVIIRNKALITNVINNNIWDLFRVLLFIVLSAGFMWLLRKNIPFSEQSKIELDNLSVLALIIISSISLFFLSFLIREIENTDGGSLRIIFSVLGIVFMNLCLILFYFRLERYFTKVSMLSIEKNNFETQLKNYQMLNQSQLRLNAIRHDLKNEHIVLSGLLEKGETKQALEYLQKNLSEIDSTEKFYTHNFVLNFLINEKINLAKTKNITILPTILLPEKVEIENEVLAVVLGNLLDNAIGAVDRNKANKEKEIQLNIKVFNNDMLIAISNKFDKTEEKSRKNRLNDGFGIKNIQRVVEEYGGIYKQTTQDDTYKTSIAFLDIYN